MRVNFFRKLRVGCSLRVKLIEIVLVEKGGASPGSTDDAWYDKNQGYCDGDDSKLTVKYRTHVQKLGWQAYVKDGDTAGTTGQSLRLEAIKIKLLNAPEGSGIEYSTHIQKLGWQDYVSGSTLSGTTGKSLRLEAIKIRLTGDLAEQYDIYYRVHAQKLGWLDWACNDAEAGTTGLSYRLEAIEICLVEKGGDAPGDTAKAYVQKGELTDLNVLMVGNSFFQVGNMANAVMNYTGGTYDSVLGAGSYLSWYLDTSTTYGQAFYKALEEKEYDYVVIQEYSNYPLLNTSGFYASVKSMCDLIKANGATPILFETWPYRTGDAFYSTSGYTYDTMATTLSSAYTQAAKNNDALVAYAGNAFYNYSGNKSALYTEEGQHPTTLGTNIAAKVVADVIFKDYVSTRY